MGFEKESYRFVVDSIQDVENRLPSWQVQTLYVPMIIREKNIM